MFGLTTSCAPYDTTTDNRKRRYGRRLPLYYTAERSSALPGQTFVIVIVLLTSLISIVLALSVAYITIVCAKN